MKKYHKDQYFCKPCKKRFRSKYAYEYHKMYHLDEDIPFRCTDCNELCTNKEVFENHKCKRKTVVGIRVEGDSTIFRGWKNVKTNQNSGETNQNNGETNQNSEEINQKGGFKCKSCHEVFATSSEVQSHYQIHALKYYCGFCGKKFMVKSKLLVHEKVHSGEYKCDRCKKRFYFKLQLKKHQCGRLMNRV